MKNLMIATMMGMAFFAISASQTADATDTRGARLNFGSQRSRYAVYVYDVNYSYHIHRGSKLYTASGRYRTTFSRTDANRIAGWLNATYSRSHMRAVVTKRFYRWSYNR